MVSRSHLFVSLALWVMLGIVLGACASSSSSTNTVPPGFASQAGVSQAGVAPGSAPGPDGQFGTPAAPADATDYVIQRGDTLNVKFYHHPDHDQEVIVRPDGKIPLHLIGDLQAAGLTSIQLAEEIVKRYSNLRDPQVAITLKAQGSRGIYVGGEVTRPSFVQYRHGVTALQAIFDAGGAKDTAKLSDVVVLQKGPDDRYRASKLNLDKVLSQGDVSGDLLLGPTDVVFVPRTAVANANLFVEQYIIRMLPVRLNLPLLY